MRGASGFGGGLMPAAEEVVGENESVVEVKGEEELELGLSLGAKRLATSDGPAARRRRIRTAKNFPPLVLPASPLPSPISSVSSSSPLLGTGGERAQAAASPEDAASARPPSPPAGAATVGWPPVRQFWLNSLFHHPKDSNAVTPQKTGGSVADEGRALKRKREEEEEGKKALLVKVHMEGDPIGRKVDLSTNRSYESLALALELMFHLPTMPPCSTSHHAKASKLLDGSGGFKLAYEDRDGDWMQVGDVPWEMFVDTVKRLRIMRSSASCGLIDPRHQCIKKMY